MKSKQAGFTLIEVLIASAIIIMSLGVLLQLFASGLDRTQRAGQVAHLLAAKRTIAHTLEVINPAQQSKGKGIAEGLAYHWQAQIAQEFRPIRDGGELSGREIALFSLLITIQTARNIPHQFTLLRLGWRLRP